MTNGLKGKARCLDKGGSTACMLAMNNPIMPFKVRGLNQISSKGLVQLVRC